ncbi:MAG: chemotaxis protein CheX [Oligoflexia bacterium]|nr:chemotaxis protein CheX [Oligoflexia bacterium]
MEFKDILRPLISTVHFVFESQCNTNVVPSKSYLQDKNETWKGIEPANHITTTALLKSNSLSFSISLWFPEEVFLKFVSSMFGEEFNELQDEIRDLASEWLNITIGNLKSTINDKMGGGFETSIPVTIVGDNLALPTPNNAPIIVLPFKSELGLFHCLLIISNEAIVPWDDSLAQLLGNLDSIGA